MGLLSGVGRVLKSPFTYAEANRIIKDAENDIEFAQLKLEQKRMHLQKRIERVGKKKIDYAANLLPYVSEIMREIRGNLNFTKTEVSQDALYSFENITLPTLDRVSTGANELIKTGFKMASASALTYAGAIGFAHMFGAASTGTAISVLNGAAASNATLAWFGGGGSIIAGGSGMTAGAIVLGSIAIAPALIIGAVKFAAHAEKKLTEAHEFRAKIDVEIEKINSMIEIVDSLEMHFNQFADVLDALANRLEKSVKHLYSVYKGNSDDELVKTLFYQSVILTKAVKKNLEIDLTKRDGTPANTDVLEHSSQIKKDTKNEKQFLNSIVDGSIVYSKKQIRRPDKIQIGNESVKYFWLQNMYRPSWVIRILVLSVLLFVIYFILMR